ncbi:MAG: hypothetical protein QOJ39_3501 [Candidatus Eremiobacteraeota bacterium]|jgi:uncharacterized protein YuzE|nr:hypothetical protein [Candidatus Eremiobacteraeota bacterium]
MQNAIELRVDLEVGAAYVRYGPRRPHGTSVRLSEDVVVHYDADSRVAGIELIAVRPDAIQIAEAFALQNALYFPSLQQYVRPVVEDEGARAVG